MPNWTRETVVVGGRQVIMVDGPVTQTVNVYDGREYEWKTRLEQPGVTVGELREFKDIAELLGSRSSGRLLMRSVSPNSYPDMKILEKTIDFVQGIATGDTRMSEHRSRPQLVRLFNEIGVVPPRD